MGGSPFSSNPSRQSIVQKNPQVVVVAKRSARLKGSESAYLAKNMGHHT